MGDSLMSQADPEYIDMQQLVSPPVPAAATIGRAVIYADTDDNVYLSIDGQPYVVIASGGGTGGTLDQAYDFGGPGAGRTITVDAGAVRFSGATPGLSTVFVVNQGPIDNTGTVTGIEINMSAAATFLAPATVNVPALSIVGAYSSVAKARGSALITVQSFYRNASTISCLVANKQSLAGSAVLIGWGAVNYEGNVAGSILTGQTHVMTIDGQTNVDAASNNVEFIGLRILTPQTTSVTAVSMRLTGHLTTVGLEASNGQSLAVSALNEGRIRYNAATQVWEASVNGGAYTTFAPVTVSLQGAYNGGAGIVVTANNPVTITDAAGVSSNLLNLSDFTAATNARIGLQWTRTGVPNVGTTYTGSAILVLNQPQFNNNATETATLVSITHLPLTGGGTVTDTSVGLSIAMQAEQPNNVVGMNVSMGTTTNTAGYAAKFSSSSLLGTAAGNGLVNINTNRNGVTSGALTFIEVGSDAASLTLGAAITGLNLNMSTNVVPGAFYTNGITITIPATTRATTTGEGALVIDSSATGQSCISITSRMTSGGGIFGAAVDLKFPAGYSLVATRTVGISSACLAQVASNDFYGFYSTVQLVGTGNTTGGNSSCYVGAYYGATTTRGVYFAGTDGNTLTTTGAYVCYRAAFDATITLGSKLAGAAYDLFSNVTASGQQVAGLEVYIATGAATSSYAALFDYRNAAGTAAGNAIVNIEVGASTTLTGQLVGVECDLTTNVTPGAQAVIGEHIVIPATTVASGRTNAAVYIDSRAENQSAFEVSIRNKTGFGYLLQYGAPVTTTSTIVLHYLIPGANSTVTLGAALGGYQSDLSTNIVPGAQALQAYQCDIGATTRADAAGEAAALRVSSTATAMRMIDCAVANTSAATGLWNLRYGTSTTLAAAITGVNIDLTTNVTTPGANQITGLRISTAASTAAAADNVAALVCRSRATAARVVDITMRNVSTNSGAVLVRYDANTTTTGLVTIMSLSPGASASTLTLGAQLIAIDSNLSSSVTHANNSIIGYRLTLPATTRVDTAAEGAIVISSTATAMRMIDCAVANVTQPTGLWCLRYGTNTTLTNAGTLVGASIDLSTSVTPGTCNVKGITITLPAASGAASVGLAISSAQTGGVGASITMTGAGGNNDHFQFVSVVDGTGAHLRGPTTATLVIKAGVPATGGAGRAVSITASDAGATSGGAGGGISLLEGAGNGGGNRGTITVGSAATAILAFYNTVAGTTQQTVTGLKGTNAALASLLTALAATGLIVDGSGP